MARRPPYTEDELRAAVAPPSLSYADALRKLGRRPAGHNFRTIQKYVRLWNISVEHFDPDASRRAASRRAHPPRPLDEVLVARSTYSRHSLKRRLFESGLKRRFCELCGQGEVWRGRRMALILDHINGVAEDNRLANLRIVCPNCAATLDTHCGRNMRLFRPCAACGREFWAGSHATRHCSQRCAATSPQNIQAALRRRRVQRPPYEQLMAEIEATSYLAVGRKYGVSDNAIRKWVGFYERERERAAAEADADQALDDAA
jgi:hypothetical protein